MTRHTDNSTVTTTEVHGDETLRDRVDAPLPPAEPKLTSDNRAQASIKRRLAGGKRKAAVTNDS